MYVNLKHESATRTVEMFTQRTGEVRPRFFLPGAIRFCVTWLGFASKCGIRMNRL